MAGFTPLDRDSSTLHPIPEHIHPWMRAVVAFGFLSFVASVSLLLVLTYRLIRWQIKSRRTNQFVILIFNLVLADIQQSLAFLLNVEWLRTNTVAVGTQICWAQGWFVSTGDLSSGVWCFLIGLHTFASVLFNFRLGTRCFAMCIVAAWVFIYGISLIGVGIHGRDLFVRAGVWCWIHHDFTSLRLWTHYFWIFIFEFGNVIIYAIIYLVLHARIHSGFYSTPEQADRAKSVANLMVVYPIVYVICTLPLASARMAAMGGAPPSYARLCLSAAMITSNGWLDVLLYTLTRRILIFSDEPPEDNNGIDTFTAFWQHGHHRSSRFGVQTTISGPPRPSKQYHRSKHSRGKFSRGVVSLRSSASSSLDDLCTEDGKAGGSKDIKLVSTTQITSEPAQKEDFEAIEEEERRCKPSSLDVRWSEEEEKEIQLEHIPD